MKLHVLESKTLSLEGFRLLQEFRSRYLPVYIQIFSQKHFFTFFSTVNLVHLDMDPDPPSDLTKKYLHGSLATCLGAWRPLLRRRWRPGRSVCCTSSCRAMCHRLCARERDNEKMFISNSVFEGKSVTKKKENPVISCFEEPNQGKYVHKNSLEIYTRMG